MIIMLFGVLGVTMAYTSTFIYPSDLNNKYF